MVDLRVDLVVAVDSGKSLGWHTLTSVFSDFWPTHNCNTIKPQVVIFDCLQLESHTDQDIPIYKLV